MNLSTLFGTYSPYLEYAWVAAPNTAPQVITGNTTPTTLTLDTKVVDTGGYGSTPNPSYIFSLSAGTYYYKCYVPIGYNTTYGNPTGNILSLYNVTAGAYVSRAESAGGNAYCNTMTLEGQFTTTLTSQFKLQIISIVGNTNVGGPNYGNSAFTGSTVGDTQRTTIKLWKLA